MVNYYDIEMVRGDTLEFYVEVDNYTGTISAVAMTCRNEFDVAIFTKTLSDGITLVSAGKYKIRVAPADTNGKTIGLYRYDIQFTIGSDKYTPLVGKLRLIEDVTTN